MKKLLALLLLILLPAPAFAAIALDTSVKCGGAGAWTQIGSSNNYTCQITTGALNNTVIVVPFIHSAVASVVTSVVDNGSAMTQVYTLCGIAGIGCSFGYIFAPTTTVNNIIVNQSVNTSDYGFAASYTGAQTTSSSGHATSSPSTSGSFSDTITPALANSWVILSGQDTNGTPAFTAGAGYTMRQTDTVGYDFYEDSNGALAASAQQVNVTQGGTFGKWGGGSIALAPFTAAAAAGFDFGTWFPF